MTYDSFLMEVNQQGLYIYEDRMPYSIKGLYGDNVICINNLIPTTIEKKCAGAEEVGHHNTTAGNILDQTDTQNRKQELRARAWGYEYLIPLSLLVEAGRAGVEGRHDVAEWLEVTEDFLQCTIEHYQRKYGLYKVVGPDLIYFEPLTLTPLC